MSALNGAMARVGVFYDGNFFFHVSNYYQYHHERRQRLSVGGLHHFIRDEVAAAERLDIHQCPLAHAHYFRGRLRASEADDRDLLFRERVFDDVLVREGVQAHYLPMSREGEKGIDVWLALEAYGLACDNHLDVAVLIACDGDYLQLVRKLASRGVRVMVLGWDFRYQDANGYERETRTAQVLLEEATYPVQMDEIIDNRTRRSELIVNGLFVPRREPLPAPVGQPAYVPAPTYPPLQSTPNRADPDVQGLEMVGTISALKNGYGFITPAVGGENIFFFHADVIDTDFLQLRMGEKVEYIATTNERGPCAKNVRLVP